MSLTKQRSAHKSDDFPTVQLFLLAIVRLAEPIALTSIYPYAWALVKRFEVGEEQDASFYAGLLISAFSLAEALMGMYWGGLSDRIGRKPVLLIGCFGTMFSMIMVGVATNIWVALAGRALGGLLNGNIGVIQTMVGELVKRPEHEPRAYSVMPFVWSIGTILGPFVGGTFADPHDSFPDLFPEGSLFYNYPYLLPNLICAGLLLVSIILGWFLLVETHPDMQPCDALAEDTYAYLSEETPLLETSDAIKRPVVDMRDDNYGTVRVHDTHMAPASEAFDVEKDDERSSSISTKRIVSIMIALCIFTYHSMTYDHLMPIFFEDDRVAGNNSTSLTAAAAALSPSASSFSFLVPGGLGLSVRDVGMIMAVNGGIALFIQAVVFPLAAERMGVYRLFILVTVLHPVAYMLVPSLLLVPESLLYPAIYFCLAVRNVLSIILYPLLLILLKEATPTPKALGKVNGMAASAGAGCRMIAPPIAGWLYTSGSKVGCSALAWYGSAVVAVVGSVQCFSVPRSKFEQGELPTKCRKEESIPK
ncbi:major facilitator superfamily transporter [Sodiomyces alkalinus F11]|uniref:Major facilitator superfamily transporter n=1 Tax=Sodiomyces alkalinus (strain CBS 110278 / VKM F-3762 / F11) TaxID=1314773 RepID=A0A3N2Q1H7_SODAK|nr:major facilitator superfamily transporter [Sodiomyces alkalinus F11]ROT40592.1 major facilitator superfamily transporter [Sodiomyces alkalinus F11]